MIVESVGGDYQVIGYKYRGRKGLKIVLSGKGQTFKRRMSESNTWGQGGRDTSFLSTPGFPTASQAGLIFQEALPGFSPPLPLFPRTIHTKPHSWPRQ